MTQGKAPKGRKRPFVALLNVDNSQLLSTSSYQQLAARVTAY